MSSDRINIAILEPSDIINEGLTNILLKNECHFFIYRVFSLDELSILCVKEQISIIVLNPQLIINKTNEFTRLKRTFNHISWIALVYSFYDNDLLSKFHDTINITDSFEIISNKLSQTIEKRISSGTKHEDLSEREIEVLIQLISGFSNKEIADKLNISIHTVISHRKNIIEKTGIRSLPGLTIFAISKKIMQLGE